MPDTPKTDLQQVGASGATRRLLTEMKDNGQIAELVDGYRLCIAVACTYGREPRIERDPQNRRTTMFAATTLDTEDLALRTAIAEIYPQARQTPYRAAEDLAEQGAEILQGYLEGESVKFTELIDRVEGLVEASGRRSGD